MAKAGSHFIVLVKRKLLGARLSGPALRFFHAFCKQRLHTRIMNDTDETIVLRAKYRDIWEGKRVRLEGRKSAMFAWTPDVYKRLGAVVETGAGRESSRPLFISNLAMGENELIVITSSCCKQGLQVKNKVQRSR